MQIQKQNGSFTELHSLLLGRILLAAPLDHLNQIPNQSQEYSLSRNCTISQRGIKHVANFFSRISCSTECRQFLYGKYCEVAKNKR